MGRAGLNFNQWMDAVGLNDLSGLSPIEQARVLYGKNRLHEAAQALDGATGPFASLTGALIHARAGSMDIANQLLDMCEISMHSIEGEDRGHLEAFTRIFRAELTRDPGTVETVAHAALHNNDNPRLHSLARTALVSSLIWSDRFSEAFDVLQVPPRIVGNPRTNLFNEALCRSYLGMHVPSYEGAPGEYLALLAQYHLWHGRLQEASECIADSGQLPGGSPWEYLQQQVLYEVEAHIRSTSGGISEGGFMVSLVRSGDWQGVYDLCKRWMGNWDKKVPWIRAYAYPLGIASTRRLALEALPIPEPACLQAAAYMATVARVEDLMPKSIQGLCPVVDWDWGVRL